MGFSMVRCLVVSLCVLALARELTADGPLPAPPGGFGRIEN